jgi:hypothetical protein
MATKLTRSERTLSELTEQVKRRQRSSDDNGR